MLRRGRTTESESIRLQLRALATRTPSLGRCGQGALGINRVSNKEVPFLSDPCVFGYVLLRKGAYRDFLHIILKHTQ